MPRAKAICIDCPNVATTRGRCDACATRVAVSRGTTTERGYGSDHRRTRASLLPKAYNRPCPLCGRTMRYVHALALHHSTPLAVDSTSRGDQIVHAACNEAASKSTGRLIEGRPLPEITRRRP